MKMFLMGGLVGISAAILLVVLFSPENTGHSQVLRMSAASLQGESKKADAPNPIPVQAQLERPEARPRSTDGESDKKARVAERVKFLADLQKRGLVGFHSTFLRSDMRLEANFLNMFGVNEAEARDMQQAVDEAGAKIEQLSFACATASRKSEDTIQIVVHPFNEGPEVYDRLINNISRVLGPERGAAFLSLFGNDLGNLFHAFGAEYREIVVKRDSESRFTISEERRTDQLWMPAEPRQIELSQLKGRLGMLSTLLPW